MTKSNKIQLILFILCVCLSISAVIISLYVIISSNKEQENLNVYQIGLKEIFDSRIDELYYDSGWSPDYRGTFYGDDIENPVSSLREVLQQADYQKASKPKTDSLSNSYAYVILTANNNRYGIAACYDRLSVTINGDSSYYYINCYNRMKFLLQNMEKELFTI